MNNSDRALKIVPSLSDKKHISLRSALTENRPGNAAESLIFVKESCILALFSYYTALLSHCASIILLS